ncbi:MAG TPA: host attachment protein [Gemmatimonadales bacterium]|nr:host attachment protein [Gemmatimonadales bacterium]
MTTSVAQDFERVLAVVLDRAHARFFEVTNSGVREVADFRSPAMHGKRFHSDRQGGPGWGEREYHGRVREEEHRHLEGVVAQLVELERERPAEGILLAGPGPATAALAKVLPAALADRVIGVTHLSPPEVTMAALVGAAEAARAAHRHAVESDLVAKMEEGVGRGAATNGARETLRALGRGQVRTLLVVPGVTGAGFRCSMSGRLVLTATDCRGEGDAVPEPDLVGQAQEEGLRQGAAIELIRDPVLAKRVDGLAALLRFAD